MHVHAGKLDGSVKSIAHTQVLVANETDTLAGVKTLMDTWHVHHVPIVDGDEVLGIISANDIHVAERCVGVIPHKVRASSFMNEPVVTITPDTSISDAADLMVKQNIHCLPIIEGVEIVGIITQTDLLRFLVQEAERADLNEQTRFYCRWGGLNE